MTLSQTTALLTVPSAPTEGTGEMTRPSNSTAPVSALTTSTRVENGARRSYPGLSG